ncbi:MAG TPA: hypothetical protein VFE25_14775 [Opitutaceae bacterium]|jgi:hypothetical protein|nr:hypothetical protein [Opitutaceae bacterium]
MHRLLIVPIVFLCCCGRAHGQAPDTIVGDSYREITTSIAPFITYDALDFHADGTYTTRLFTVAATVQGLGSYYSLLNGTFVYNKLSATEASIILNPTNGNSETRMLSFSSSLGGSISKDAGEVAFRGTFNLSPPASPAATSLINVSTLVAARKGSPVTVGFVVGGGQIREFLIRVVGPSLASFAVSSPAAVPVYSLVGQSSTVFPMPGAIRAGLFPASGDGWSVDPVGVAAITAETTRAGAFPLPIGSRDKSDLYLLSPGAYTIVVSPQSSSSEGNVLIEAYEVQ